MKRPDCIKHYSEIAREETAPYPGSDELFTKGSPFGKVFGFQKLGIHHEILKPGRRSCWPHAERDEEEFVYVIEGHPEVWLDGHTYKLNPGDGVGFPIGTGISHCLINNTDKDVRLLSVGEKSRPESKCFYPMHPKRNAEGKEKGWLWENPPTSELGPHNGLPDKANQNA